MNTTITNPIECCGEYTHLRDKLGRLFCDKCNVIWTPPTTQDPTICPHCDGPKSIDEPSCRWELCEAAAQHLQGLR